MNKESQLNKESGVSNEQGVPAQQGVRDLSHSILIVKLLDTYFVFFLK